LNILISSPLLFYRIDGKRRRASLSLNATFEPTASRRIEAMLVSGMPRDPDPVIRRNLAEPVLPYRNRLTGDTAKDDAVGAEMLDRDDTRFIAAFADERDVFGPHAHLPVPVRHHIHRRGADEPGSEGRSGPSVQILR
jgi:hypothetical protein